MGTFVTEDGRRVPFIDWANVFATNVIKRDLMLTEQRTSDELESSRPQLIAANDLLDRNLLAFIQG